MCETMSVENLFGLMMLTQIIPDRWNPSQVE
jgi:hypothetical protein